MTAIPQWFTPQQLVGLPGMPTTDRGIRMQNQKNLLVSRNKLRGKGLEYALSSLPAETQEYLVSKYQAASFEVARIEAKKEQALAVKVKVDGVCEKFGQVRKVKTAQQMTDKDRAYQDAALLLMLAVDEAKMATDTSTRQCCIALAHAIYNGSARQELRDAAATVYIKPRGVLPYGGLDALTARLQKMHGFYQEGCRANAPAVFLIAGRTDGSKRTKQEHITAFLAHYCHPNRPTVTQAWKNSAQWYAANGFERPAVDTFQRIEKMLPVTTKNRGRMTGAAYKSLLPYISRDVSMFHSNDIWVGDGHTFKARVQSPIHGQAFRPEVTFIIDWRSRKLVGWSVALSENVIAVSDAFRHAQLQTRARPLIYYSDNGSGQTGKLIDHPMHGTLGRQGILHETGIPGSPQGRGIIERVWASTVIPLAATYATYLGNSADRDTVRKIGIALEKSKRKGESSPLLPSFPQFLADLEKCVNEYNATHSHSGIDGMFPDDAYQKYMDENSVMQGVTNDEINALWMPETERTVQRGIIRLFGNEYQVHDLAHTLPEDAKVRVRFDIHNAETVRVLDYKTGQFLCMGIWDGHRKAAFPVAYVEDARQKRAQGIKRRAQVEIDRADAELTQTIDVPAIEYQPAEVLSFGSPQRVSDAVDVTQKQEKTTDFATLFCSGKSVAELEEEARKAEEQIQSDALLHRINAVMQAQLEEEEEKRRNAM